MLTNRPVPKKHFEPGVDFWGAPHLPAAPCGCVFATMLGLPWPAQALLGPQVSYLPVLCCEVPAVVSAIVALAGPTTSTSLSLSAISRHPQGDPDENPGGAEAAEGAEGVFGGISYPAMRLLTFQMPNADLTAAPVSLLRYIVK